MLDVADSPVSRLGLQLEAVVVERLKEDKLILPPMPGVAAKCLKIIQDADFRVATVAALVETDPILAARVLRRANSAELGTAPARNLQIAVTRLGQRGLQTILLETSIRSVFESRNWRIAEAARAVWQHSVAVGLLGREVAALLKCSEPEDAYLSGLLHDVGKPVLAVMLLETEKSLSSVRREKRPWMDSTEWVACLHRSHRRVGVALAKSWKLPDSVVNAIEHCCVYDELARTSIANQVRFANALCKLQGLYVGEFDLDHVTSLVAEGRTLLGIDEAQVERLILGLGRRVSERLCE